MGVCVCVCVCALISSQVWVAALSLSVALSLSESLSHSLSLTLTLSHSLSHLWRADHLGKECAYRPEMGEGVHLERAAERRIAANNEKIELIYDISGKRGATYGEKGGCRRKKKTCQRESKRRIHVYTKHRVWMTRGKTSGGVRLASDLCVRLVCETCV